MSYYLSLFSLGPKYLQCKPTFLCENLLDGIHFEAWKISIIKKNTHKKNSQQKKRLKANLPLRNCYISTNPRNLTMGLRSRRLSQRWQLIGESLQTRGLPSLMCWENTARDASEGCRFLEPAPRDAESVSLRWGLRTCISRISLPSSGVSWFDKIAMRNTESYYRSNMCVFRA